MRKASGSTAQNEQVKNEHAYTDSEQDKSQVSNVPPITRLPKINVRKLQLVSNSQNEKKQKKQESLKQDFEIRLEGTTGSPVQNIVHFRAPRIPDQKSSAKKPKKIDLTKPPKLKGCKWIKTDDGWNLWRIKREKDPISGAIITKSRYAGSLSLDGWNVMKEYDYETLVSIIADRIGRYRRS